MKRLIMISLFASGILAASAQTNEPKKDSYPYWTISKDVQRIQYKNVIQVKPEITNEFPVWSMSKGVNKINSERLTRDTAPVATKGYPTWNISKGVARMNMERKNNN